MHTAKTVVQCSKETGSDAHPIEPYNLQVRFERRQSLHSALHQLEEKAREGKEGMEARRQKARARAAVRCHMLYLLNRAFYSSMAAAAAAAATAVEKNAFSQICMTARHMWARGLN